MDLYKYQLCIFIFVLFHFIFGVVVIVVCSLHVKNTLCSISHCIS